MLGILTVAFALCSPDQLSDKRAHVIYAVPAPPKPGTKFIARSLADISGISKDLENLSDSWCALHAEQVRRCLPGGLNVVGVFLFAPGTLDSAATLRRLLYAACGEYTRCTISCQSTRADLTCWTHCLRASQKSAPGGPVA